MDIRLRKEQEWTDYHILEIGNWSISLSFRSIFQTLALFIAVWWAWSSGQLASEMDTARVAYLFGGLKEFGTNGGTVHFCTPLWKNGTLLTNGQFYLGWDCRSEKQLKTDCDWQDILNSNITNILNTTGGG